MRLTMKIGVSRAVVAALTLVLAAGCGGRAGGTGGGHAAAHGSSSKTAGGLAGLSLSLGNSPNSLVLPLTPYVASGEQMTEQVSARNVLASRCMQKSGFDYTPPVGITKAPMGADPGEGAAYDFGITSMTLARQYGYGALNPFFPAQAPSPRPQPPGQLPAAEQAALTSCNRSLRKVPDMPHIPQLAQLLQEQAWQETVTGSAAQALFRRWSACMAASGYDYADPVQAALGEPGDSDGPSQWSGASPSQLEIQTAVADVTCKDKTGVVQQWIRLLAEDQEALVQHYLPQLQSAISAYQRDLSRLQQKAGT
jgi:hypothetical protein